MTVLNQVTSNSSHDKTAMKKLLFGCTEITPAISNVEHYARIVSKSHKARQLQSIFQSFAFDGVNAENADEPLEKVMSELFSIAAKRQSKKLQDIGEVGFSVLESHMNAEDSENTSNTGFSKLDATLKGMSAGNLIIWAARPKIGKAAFALSIAENVAKSGKTVSFIAWKWAVRNFMKGFSQKVANSHEYAD